MSSVEDPLTELEREMGGRTSVLEREMAELEEPGDRDRFSHYARREKIMESLVTGVPIVALCGKVWVPSRDPKKFPVCPECKRIYEHMHGGGESGPGDDGTSD